MRVSELGAFLSFRRHPGMAVAVLVTIAGLSLLFLTAQGGRPRQALVLQGVSADDLAADRIALFVPEPDEKARFSQGAATQYAEMQFGGEQTIRQVALAVMMNTDSILPKERLVWVISYEPSTVEVPLPWTPELSPPPYRTVYALMFIDAGTGEELLTTVSSEPE